MDESVQAVEEVVLEGFHCGRKSTFNWKIAKILSFSHFRLRALELAEEIATNATTASRYDGYTSSNSIEARTSNKSIRAIHDGSGST